MGYSYLNLKDKKVLNSTSCFKKEQILSKNKDIGITINYHNNINIFNIRGNYKISDFQMLVNENFKYKVPSSIGRFNQNKISFLLNLGPDELLFISLGSNLTTIEKLEKNLKRIQLTITKVSDQYEMLNLTGKKVRWILSKGCPINLDKNFTVPGLCFQTILGHSNVILFCKEENSFSLLILSSYLDYVINWLKVSSHEHGYKIFN